MHSEKLNSARSLVDLIEFSSVHWALRYVGLHDNVLFAIMHGFGGRLKRRSGRIMLAKGNVSKLFGKL